MTATETPGTRRDAGAPAVRGPARTLTRRPLPPAARRRRALHAVRGSDVNALAGSAVGAVALTWLAWAVLAPLSGGPGFVLVAYAVFVGLYALVVSFDEDGVTVRDRVAAVLVTTLGLVLLSALVFIVVFTFGRALPALRHANFFVQDLSLAGPLDPLDRGGVLHAVIGTLEQIAIALAITIPLGLTAAVFLSELPGRYARTVRTIVEAMTALPSIVAGLFVYSTLIIGIDVGGVHLHLPKSGLAAALAISVMMLPIIIRAADVVLRLVPGTLTEASYALGTSQWRTVWHVVLPTARSGLTTAVILGTARGIGETSPVLITAGFTTETNAVPWSDAPQVSLPLATFSLVRSPQQVQIDRGFGAAAVLLVLVLTLFVTARILGGRAPGELSARQARRRALQSAGDLDRFEARRRPYPADRLFGAPAPERQP